MSATPQLADRIAPEHIDAQPSRSRGWLRGGAVLVAVVVGGALFMGVPSTNGDSLPDATQMALVAAGRNSAEANVDYWQRRVDSVPTSVAFRSQLAAAQLTLAGDQGDLAGYAIAEATARAAVDLDPADGNAQLVLAATLAGQHEFQAALDLAQGVLVAEPGSIAALLAAGDAQLALGRYEAAQASFDAAARTAGGIAPLLSRQARVRSLIGTVDEAHDLARRALVEAGRSDNRTHDAAFYWFQLATYAFARGDAEVARSHLEKALTIAPEHGASQELIAKVYVATGDLDAATSQYEQLTDGGGAADIHGELAKLYARDGRAAEANEQIALGLAVAEADADRFPAERRHLISFLVDHDPREALRLAELDLVDRQDVHAHAWYAWALHEVGEFEAAAAAIEPALTYGTEDARLLYQAGVISASVGDRERAHDLLNRALDLNPWFDVEQAEHARELLATR